MNQAQPALFHESISDALRELVGALGGPKAVGARMRPEMPPDHAGRWLADCLNDGRREHLSPAQVMWLLREGRSVGHHHAMRWLAGEVGYSDPQPIEADDERTRLQREYVEAARSMQRMAERIERLSQPAVARVA